MVLKVIYSDFSPIFSISQYCSINTNKTENPSLLSLWTVSAQQAPLPVPVQNITIQDQESLSAPGPDCPCQARAFPGQVAGFNTGLQHLILVLLILNLLWKPHGPLGPYLYRLYHQSPLQIKVGYFEHQKCCQRDKQRQQPEYRAFQIFSIYGWTDLLNVLNLTQP